uniref:Vps39_2 domain-containing protein n=1 Tax=Macrostomum lignano TaxID=282301 RepID=A0A1I8FDP6_9PLAT
SHKSFSKRPIQQLEAVVPLSLLISLSDGTVSVHNLDTLKALSVLDRTRGASLFACCHQTRQIPEAEAQTIQLAPVRSHVKQRLLLYHWPPGAWQFAELRQELALPAAAEPTQDYVCQRGRAAGDAVRKATTGRDGQVVQGALLLQYLAPFLIGICADFVEVRTVDQRTSLIQNLDIPSLRLASSQHPRRVVRCLCQRRDFELALRLHEIGQCGSGQADELLRTLTSRCFAESLDLLELLSIVIRPNVVAMYPIVRRGSSGIGSAFPAEVPPPPPIQFYTVDKYQAITADLEKLRQLVDTSLLKCYLESNPALVAFPASHHQLLSPCARRKPISNIEDSVQYLQELGVPYQDLIFRYSRWIIERDPKEGLRIFTESQADGDNALPRIEVANFLESSAPQLLTDYLEHCVLHCKPPDTSESLHTRLANQYRLRLEQQTGPLAVAGARSRLLAFLRRSRHYNAQELLARYPNNDMLEERALLLSRLGQYELAFTILAQYLESPEKAESLAEEILSQPTAETGDAADSSLAILQGEVYGAARSGANDAARATIIETPAGPDTACPSPAAAAAGHPLADLSDYLLTSLQRLEAEKRLLQSRRGLYHAERLQTAAAFARVRSGRVAIEEGTRCSVCQNRIGASAFARFPSRQVTHYGCMAVMRARLSGRTVWG